MTRHLLLLACVCALALPAGASAAGGLPFDITVKGQITERWARSFSEDYGACPQQIHDEGGATIRFETLKPQRATAAYYSGWRGNPKVQITSERHGTKTVSGHEDWSGPTMRCDDTPQTTGGPCGLKTFSSPLTLDYNSRPFRIGLVGEHDEWSPGSDCLYTPHPETYDDFDDYGWDPLALVHDAGPKLKVPYTMWVYGGRFKGREIRARRQWTFRYSDRVTIPYRRYRNGPAVGTYTADVEYAITFRRIGKIWRPPSQR